MKANNQFTRISKAIEGSEVVKLSRSHATMPADDKVKKANPQRMDILRRHALSTRNNDNA